MNTPLSFLVGFLLWTFLTYWLHRAAHRIQILWSLHSVHHKQEYTQAYDFSWRHLFLIYGDWRLTLDQLLLEVAPLILTLILIPKAWGLVVYFIVSNSISESTFDHNPKVDIPFVAAGRYHSVHHQEFNLNFDMHTWLWDLLFGTKQTR